VTWADWNPGGIWGQAPVNPNNRLQPPYQYDASGNMTADATHTYFYDAESRLIQVGGTLGNCSTATACYVYDAEGQRLEKLAGGTTTAYLRNSNGEVVAETDGGNTLLRAGYVYAGGALLAEYENGTTNFVLKDHLGDTRVMTTYSTTAAQNAQVYDSMDYLPYGEQILGGTGTTHKFTGKERDAETASTPGGLDGLDDFDARYYSSNLGRFVSADWSVIPEPVPYADFSDPQSLNLYSYVRNLPTVKVDADGHCIEDACIIEGALVVAGVAYVGHSVYKWIKSQSSTFEKAREAAAANQEVIDNATNGNYKDLDKKAGEATAKKIQVLKDAEKLAIQGSTLPGTSTGGLLPTTATEAVTAIVQGAIVNSAINSTQNAANKKHQPTPPPPPTKPDPKPDGRIGPKPKPKPSSTPNKPDDH
jgi:RHS repeat-associated protein